MGLGHTAHEAMGLGAGRGLVRLLAGLEHAQSIGIVPSTTSLQLLHGNPQIIRKNRCGECLALVLRAAEALGQSRCLLADELARSSEAVARRMGALDILII